MSDADEMRYWKVRWLHDLPDEPVELYSEIDEDDYERRKVEIYRDGHADYAGPTVATGSTMLSEVPVGTFEDIALLDDFEPIKPPETTSKGCGGRRQRHRPMPR
ncbi:DUF6881 domain-containing protein [Paractinoplanes ferrugineus]|uniref:DUF6881 domain-containing protein n=1 Tax=Paractinoplanes ferrugineus TaxID=113564 RepID=UPI00194213EE|nr:hypothetical protein [Actinoplanes ferrugineus]